MNKVRVIVIEHSLPFYHVPAWQLLGSHPEIELTIAYGQGFFTGEKNGVPEGEIPYQASFKHKKCKIVKSIFGKKFLWNSASINLLQEKSFDIVIHQFELKMLSLLPALYFAKRAKTKFLLWGIGNPLTPSRFTDIIRRNIAKRVDAMVFYSEVNKNRYLDWGIESRKLFVAKNSVDVATIIKLSKSWNRKKVEEFKNTQGIPGYLIMTIGRLIERKKIEWLIHAMKLLVPEFPDLKLVIIGNGPEYEKLTSLSASLNLSSSIVFTGRLVGFDSIAPWFLASDLIVAPAQVGHMATEAHAYGIPLLLSDNNTCQGPESEILIPEETGLLYKHSDTADLANKIRYVLSNPDFRINCKQKSQNRAQEFAGTELMVNGFINSINQLLSKNLSHF